MKYLAFIAAVTAVKIEQKESRIQEKDKGFHGYTTWYDGFEGNGEWRDAYERKVPEAFTGEQRDTFTEKMIAEFALEGMDKDTHKPNGHFTVSKEKTKEASYEVLKTHLGLEGAAADEHLSKYFDQVWDHMDVLGKGSLEAVELNKFMRDLCKPVKEHIILE